MCGDRPNRWIEGRYARTPGGSHPAPPSGWDPEDAADLARLLSRQRERAALIVTRAYWSGRAPGGVSVPGRDSSSRVQDGRRHQSDTARVPCPSRDIRCRTRSPTSKSRSGKPAGAAVPFPADQRMRSSDCAGGRPQIPCCAVPPQRRPPRSCPSMVKRTNHRMVLPHGQALRRLISALPRASPTTQLCRTANRRLERMPPQHVDNIRKRLRSFPFPVRTAQAGCANTLRNKKAAATAQRSAQCGV